MKYLLFVFVGLMLAGVGAYAADPARDIPVGDKTYIESRRCMITNGKYCEQVELDMLNPSLKWFNGRVTCGSNNDSMSLTVPPRTRLPIYVEATFPFLPSECEVK